MRHKDLSRAFGEVLRKQRKKTGITQEALAEMADIDPKMVSLIERLVRNPSLNLADSIAQSLGVPLSKLIKSAETLRQKSSKST